MKKTTLLLVFCCTTLPLWAQKTTDKKASKQTLLLYQKLVRWRTKGIMFGQQDALAYGLNADQSRWVAEPKRCDVQTVTGDYPAVIGYDLGKLEFDSTHNLDGVAFAKIKQDIQDTYQRGGINTISWHFNNPVTPTKNTWDKADSTIKHLFASAQAMQTYTAWLDKLAHFVKSLKGKNGQTIPVLFRPFHEHTGSWFWWGANHCSPEEYIKLWRFTVDYLKNKKGVHNLLYAYSTDHFKDEAHYLERYPGDAYVDLIGFDYYHRNAPASNADFVKEATRMVQTLEKLGKQKHKLTAITEMGLEQVTEPTWWTQIVWPIVQSSQLSYFLVWRNGRPDHYYAPFEGQKSAEDFIKFYRLPQTLFLKDLQAH